MREKYKPSDMAVPQERRAEINEKILYVCDTASPAIPDEMIYNCYTGDGGLHGLSLKDFDNFHDYSEAKKEVECGQFLTSPVIASLAVSVLGVQDNEKVMDACCGAGAFFNYLPVEGNAYGFDIDPKALKVARRLYPEANLRLLDARVWAPEGEERMDVCLINPPFHINFGTEKDKINSEMYVTLKCADALTTAGLLAVICPATFLEDLFWNRSDIEQMNGRYSFIGQCRLPDDAFKAVGVEKFETKLMVWSLRCDALEARDYDASFCSPEELGERVAEFRRVRHAERLHVLQESLATNKDTVFSFELKKVLYQIKAHPATRAKHADALAYYEKYRTQRMPEELTKEEQKEWDRNKLTPEKVLSYCRRILRGQSKRPARPGIRLVCDRSGFKFKAETASDRKTLNTLCDEKRLWRTRSFRDTITDGLTLDFDPTVKDLLSGVPVKSAEKVLRRRRREYNRQMLPLRHTEPSEELTAWLEAFRFRKNGLECALTDLQKEDLGHLMSKRYCLINWEQGSGKTPAQYAFGKRLLETGATRCVFIVAPAQIARERNGMWQTFLAENEGDYVTLKSRTDIEHADVRGKFVLIPLSMVGRLHRPLQRLVKTLNNKVTLLLDESDELTNPLSARTRSVLAVFRRVHHKMLATGTTTRNNIGEFYSQMELLFNNSLNFLCDCPYVYEESHDSEDDEEEMNCVGNDHYMRPFPPKGGHRLFRSCYCPGRTTVFGIDKFNQDVYNADSLWALCERTVITRRFREFAGDKYSITTHRVEPTESETAVYTKIFHELESLIPLYFSPIPDTKKAAGLRLVRQLNLLIKACSIPHLMPGYGSAALPTKTEKILSLLETHREKVIVGTTTLEALGMYRELVEEHLPERPLFVIDGSVPFKRRQTILKEFEATADGILVCTQQSLKSGVNIPTCNMVVIESLQWNIPKISQFFFRTIRFDSRENTVVHFVTYNRTVEQNIMALLLNKQRLNEFIKCGSVESEEDISKEFGTDFLDGLIGKEKDSDGNVFFTWAGQRISA